MVEISGLHLANFRKISIVPGRTYRYKVVDPDPRPRHRSAGGDLGNGISSSIPFLFLYY